MRGVADQTGFGLNECIAKMLEADGILIGSPTYYANCTATTQALLERAAAPAYRSAHGLDDHRGTHEYHPLVRA